jgi:hypothetical protein
MIEKGRQRREEQRGGEAEKERYIYAKNRRGSKKCRIEINLMIVFSNRAVERVLGGFAQAVLYVLDHHVTACKFKILKRGGDWGGKRPDGR